MDETGEIGRDTGGGMNEWPDISALDLERDEARVVSRCRARPG